MANETGLDIFTGRFGSGKTETAINYALSLVGEPEADHPTPGVILIDLDLVTPYFRTRETAGAMRTRGVEVLAPSIIGQHLDTPAITPQLLGAIQQRERPTVLDVGGDPQGARALGQFSTAVEQRGYAMYFVVNVYRPFTDSAEGLAASIAEIEATSRLKTTALVSNPNLIGETTADAIRRGHAQIETFAREMGLPIAFLCVEQRWAQEPQIQALGVPILVLERFFEMSWE